MVTGYEQVRSVVAELAGDHKAARAVQLVLPETGVCSGVPLTEPEADACCGGPAPAEVDSCYANDAAAKAKDGAGCGCASVAAAETAPATAAGCCQSAA
jgi:hypothetical protein